jgi:hypothetical protein
MEEMNLINYVLTSGGGAGAGVLITYLFMTKRMDRLEKDIEGCKANCTGRLSKVESEQHSLQLQIMGGINDLKIDMVTMRADVAVVKAHTDIAETLKDTIKDAVTRLIDTQEVKKQQ